MATQRETVDVFLERLRANLRPLEGLGQTEEAAALVIETVGAVFAGLRESGHQVPELGADLGVDVAPVGSEWSYRLVPRSARGQAFLSEIEKTGGGS